MMLLKIDLSHWRVKSQASRNKWIWISISIDQHFYFFELVVARFVLDVVFCALVVVGFFVVDVTTFDVVTGFFVLVTVDLFVLVDVTFLVLVVVGLLVLVEVVFLLVVTGFWAVVTLFDVVVGFWEVVETFLLVVVAGFVMAHLHRLVRADAVYCLNGDVVLELQNSSGAALAIWWCKTYEEV
jgi:hypothetical protein